jgi:hypothetical protein
VNEQDIKELETLIDKAWQEFSQIAEEEENEGYSDITLSVDRAEANGFAVGLESAYRILVGKTYITNTVVYKQED